MHVHVGPAVPLGIESLDRVLVIKSNTFGTVGFVVGMLWIYSGTIKSFIAIQTHTHDLKLILKILSSFPG